MSCKRQDEIDACTSHQELEILKLKNSKEEDRIATLTEDKGNQNSDVKRCSLVSTSMYNKRIQIGLIIIMNNWLTWVVIRGGNAHGARTSAMPSQHGKTPNLRPSERVDCRQIRHISSLGFFSSPLPFLLLSFPSFFFLSLSLSVPPSPSPSKRTKGIGPA